MTVLLNLLKQRRSIRQFTDEPIEQEKRDYLVECMLRSPSSRGLNPWEFIVVDDRKKIEKLAMAKAHGSVFAKSATLLFVVCANPEKSDVWVEDTSIATLLLHLGAEDLGLGSCWIQIRKREHDQQISAEEYVKKTLGLPDEYVVEAMVAMGYPKEKKEGHDKESLLYERVHLNEF